MDRHQRSSSSIGIATVAVAIMFAGGCAQRESETTAPSAESEQASVEPTPSPTSIPLTNAHAPTDAIVIGIDTDMSGSAARSGEAIRRGALLAVDEINASGGLLGKTVTVEVRDHRGNPARGVDNIKEFAAREDVIAIVGGLHTPVALSELDAVHEAAIPFLIPWAAGTPVVSNGRDPNFVFRVSARDADVGPFLVEQLIGQGFTAPALFLEETAWGRSNHLAMTNALDRAGLSPANVTWFNWSLRDFTPQISQAYEDGADVIVFVGNAPEGESLLHGLAEIDVAKRLPVRSHWGITGGHFFDDMHLVLTEIDLQFVQTYSFVDAGADSDCRRVVERYAERFPNAESAEDIFAPAGTAHAYDLVHMLARAVRSAGTTDGDAIRRALLEIDSHDGLVRTYSPPFTVQLQDALGPEDLCLARYDERGVIRRISHVAVEGGD